MSPLTGIRSEAADCLVMRDEQGLASVVPPELAAEWRFQCRGPRWHSLRR